MNIQINEYTQVHMPEVLELYASVGWTNYTQRPDMLGRAIKGSLKVLAATADGRLAGLIRAVGDGVSIVYIQDILVLPKYQGAGIGRSLVEAMAGMYPHVYQTVLMTDDRPQTVGFYQRCGFCPAGDYKCTAMVRFCK